MKKLEDSHVVNLALVEFLIKRLALDAFQARKIYLQQSQEAVDNDTLITFFHSLWSSQMNVAAALAMMPSDKRIKISKLFLFE